MSSAGRRASVRDLLEKYRVMRALRTATGGAPPRELLRDLARRFPGALAEIDRIAPALLDERIAQLEALVLLDGVLPEGVLPEGVLPEGVLPEGVLPDWVLPDWVLPDWVRGWLLAHARLRGALAVNAWLAGRRTIDAETRARFDAEPFPEEARAWSDRLEELADPPGGRIVALVYDEVARALGVSPTEVRTLLMPRPLPPR